MEEQQSLFGEEVTVKEEVEAIEEEIVQEDTAQEEVVEEDIPEEEVEEELFEGIDGKTYSAEEWSEPVFEGGPTREYVDMWKRQYGKIFMVPFDHETYIIRGLTRPEYRSIQLEKAKSVEANEQEPLEKRLEKKFDNEELVASICTLWPVHAQSEEYFMHGAPAGTSGTMAEMIYDKSAFRALTPPIAL